jgi:site-specific DNA-methyltransferase (adenine-specific)
MIELFNEDCIETMKRIPDGSIDLMLTDPPYNTTACKWEYALNFELLWTEWNRIVKQNGAFVFTASQPFTTDLIISNRQNFKYEMIWDKGRPSNFMLSKYQVLKMHENIIVFYREQPTFYPQKTKRNDWDKRPANKGNTKIVEVTGQKRIIPDALNDEKLDGSIIRILRNPIAGHPTEKPLDLFRYLIQTFSNECDTIFDGYSGSGTTAIACIKEKRNFIGSELDKMYYDKSVKRIRTAQMQKTLF